MSTMRVFYLPRCNEIVVEIGPKSFIYGGHITWGDLLYDDWLAGIAVYIGETEMV